MVRYYDSKIDSRPRNPGIMPIDPREIDKVEANHQIKYAKCRTCLVSEDVRRESCVNGICALEYQV